MCLRQEKKRRSWPSQAHHLGLLAVIWMGALSLQLFGVNNFVWPQDLSVLTESTSISGPIERFHLLFIPGSWTHLSSLSPSSQFSWPQLGLTSFQGLHCLYFWLLEKAPELASSKALEADFMASGSSVLHYFQWLVPLLDTWTPRPYGLFPRRVYCQRLNSTLCTEWERSKALGESE